MKNTEKLNRLVQWMKARNNAQTTIQLYKHHLEVFFKAINEDSSRMSEKMIQDYILGISSNLSFSYKNQVINAIKIYFQVIENRKLDELVLPRPISQQFIPNILSVEQTKRVIFNTENLKHRTLLFVMYDNGLRISELLNITLMDFRTKTETPHLIIRDAKHHSSRIIPLSADCVNMVRDYYKAFQPKKFLFEGEKQSEVYSETSVRNIFIAALKREKIKVRIRVHDLRHSFATHCLANGMDIYQLSKILGHRSVATTEKYYAHLNFSQMTIRRTSLHSSSSTYKNIKAICNHLGFLILFLG